MSFISVFVFARLIKHTIFVYIEWYSHFRLSEGQYHIMFFLAKTVANIQQWRSLEEKERWRALAGSLTIDEYPCIPPITSIITLQVGTTTASKSMKCCLINTTCSSLEALKPVLVAKDYDIFIFLSLIQF